MKNSLIFSILSLLCFSCEKHYTKTNEYMFSFPGVWEKQDKRLVFTYISRGNSNSYRKYSLFTGNVLSSTCYNAKGFNFEVPEISIECDNGDKYLVKRTDFSAIGVKGPYKTAQEVAVLSWETYAFSRDDITRWVKD